MIPQLALGLFVLLIVYLIRHDSKCAPRTSPAVWIPTLWLLINGSRQVSQWITSGPQFTAHALHDGNPIDQVVYGVLILAGIGILARRRVQIQSLAKFNSLIVLFFLYEGISILWSDFPFVAGKRWIKASGDFVMVFVLVTDPAPVRAITAVIKRSGYILIPLSLLFCKYYPDLGRNFDPWGVSYYTGVTMDKNMFGYLQFAYGVFYASALLRTFGSTASPSSTRTDRLCSALLLSMIIWMIPLADSKTSLLSLIAGVMLVLALQLSTVRRNPWPWILGSVLVLAILNEFLSLQSAVTEAAGRDATLTGRTGIWEMVLSEPNSALFGTGYASFWLGERLQRIWDLYPRTPLTQAHNGYIEIYINLGIIGVAILGGMLWTGLRNTRRRLTALEFTAARPDERTYQTFGMAYVSAYLIYNITEATFMGLNFLFIIFLLVAFDFPRINTRSGSGGVRPLNSGLKDPRGQKVALTH